MFRKLILKLVAVGLLMTVGANARKSIVIDLTKQEIYAYNNGRMVMSGWVSTGKYGHRTPRGRFRILEKDLRHVSSKYPEPTGGARMDYMMRLTNSGIAMHLGFVPNYPASHGCIRLPNGLAQRLFRWAPVGTPVRIKGYSPVRVSRNLGTRRGIFSAMRSNRSNSRGVFARRRGNTHIAEESYRRVKKLRRELRIPRKSRSYKRRNNNPLDILKV